jgi:hypothetical protein
MKLRWIQLSGMGHKVWEKQQHKEKKQHRTQYYFFQTLFASMRFYWKNIVTRIIQKLKFAGEVTFFYLEDPDY